MSEEIVRVNLGDDYYKGAYFDTFSGPKDYEVPRSQLERWEAVEAAYLEMQDEIEQVMKEQQERVAALNQERRGSLGEALARLYEASIKNLLSGPPLPFKVPESLRGPRYKEPE